MPRVGLATDLRTLRHIGEVFKETNCKALMCFICGCKHLYQYGYDKFGDRQSKGTIDYRNNTSMELFGILHGNGADKPWWQRNMSFATFEELYGDAVTADEHLHDRASPWRRQVYGTDHELLCNPEDVDISDCQHDDQYVCTSCRIPICDECWRRSLQRQSIPKAIANDNFIGYMHDVFWYHEPNWLEVTIAVPVFVGLICYYIEGAPSERHHMMESIYAQPERAYGVRGMLAISSILLAMMV